MFAESSDLIY